MIHKPTSSPVSGEKRTGDTPLRRCIICMSAVHKNHRNQSQGGIGGLLDNGRLIYQEHGVYGAVSYNDGLVVLCM